MSAVAVATGEKVTVSASVSGSGSARSSHKLRALRHLASEFGVGPISVTAWHPRLQVVNLTCENLSMSGLCLRLLGGAGAGQRAEVSADDWVLGVHASLQSGEVVCHSDAIVRHCRADGDDLPRRVGGGIRQERQPAVAFRGHLRLLRDVRIVRPPAVFARQVRRHLVLENRRVASFSRQRRMIASSCGGASGRTLRSGSGGLAKIAAYTSGTVEP